MAVPPLQLPILKDSKEDSLCGEVQYRLGGQFWPAKCIARLHGDLLLIQRAGKQQAAVALHGASVELRAQGTVCIEAPGSPLLALRLETEEEAERWWKELKKAAHRAKGFKDLVSSGNVPLMLSPRSEAEWNEAEQRMERLRLQLAAEQNAKVEIEDRFGETLAAQEAEKEARKTEEELRQEAQQKAEDLQKQLEALSEQFTATASEKDMAHVQVNQMKTEAEQLEQELKALQAELSETGTRLAQVEGKNAGLQDRTKLLEEALENEQEKRVQSEAKVRELQQKQSLESAKLAEAWAWGRNASPGKRGQAMTS
ncbi:unnamed protein product [Effrenium voratum]|uniref:PH domain-containing protein n=1 Tax=Effrenium voratum TaxID=2562239 RepID=A0AA36IZ92_9DINO|nr:unnamed protein product [Effrenium voratum]